MHNALGKHVKTRPFTSIEWRENSLYLLDQRLIPHEAKYVKIDRYEDVVTAIQSMLVRGAPAIGIAAAYGVSLAAQQWDQSGSLNEYLKNAVEALRMSRPTAVNLSWALNSLTVIIAAESDPTVLTKKLLDAAHRIYQEDIDANMAIARHGLTLIPPNASIIHHCNTGSLATADYGTALGIIRYAHEQGRNIHAYLDETRPRLQGLCLSAYELIAYQVPHTVIIDSASGHVMKTRAIDLCVVGCDRVAANGDTANKIGTYNLALVAKAHGVPFYVACPTSTIDRDTPTGDTIEIESRAAEEITHTAGARIAPIGTNVYNPAFDVTPASLITAFITEKGILYPPFIESLRSLS